MNNKKESENSKYRKSGFKDIAVYANVHRDLKSLSVQLNIPMYELATKAIKAFILKN